MRTTLKANDYNTLSGVLWRFPWACHPWATEEDLLSRPEAGFRCKPLVCTVGLPRGPRPQIHALVCVCKEACFFRVIEP